jgi:hypothetical protein
MRLSTVLISLTLILMLSSQSWSQYSAREDFAYLTGKSLDSLGTSGNGWGGPWMIDTSNSHNYNLSIIADTGYNYADLNFSYPYIGNNLVSQSPGNWAAARYFRPLDKVWPETKGQYWVSYLFQTQSTPTGNTYYLLKLYSGSTELVAVGKGGGGTTYSCGSGWPGGAGDDVSSTEDQGGPVWLVAMVNLTGDATADVTARTYMWINPDPSKTPDTNSADVKRNTNLSKGFDRVAIEFGGADTMQLGYDEIRLGTSFTSVSSSLVSPGHLAVESFDYTAGANAFITGVGGAENGWAGPWHLDPGDTGVNDSLMIVSSTGLQYDMLTYDVVHAGNLLYGARPADRYTRYERALDKTWTQDSGTVFWFSALIELTNDTNSSTWAGIKLCQDHTDAAIMFGKGYGQDLYTIGGGYHASATDPECSTTTWDVGPVWLVGEIVNKGLGNQSPAYMWINPDPKFAPDTTKADAKSQVALIPGISYVRVEFGGAVPFEMAVDEIRLGTTYNDVATGIKQISSALPKRMTLSQNYPNPFNPTTKINYSVPKTGYVSLKIYNILGQVVATLFSGEQRAGSYIATFDAAKLASGVYMYRLETGGAAITKKLVLLK